MQKSEIPSNNSQVISIASSLNQEEKIYEQSHSLKKL